MSYKVVFEFQNERGEWKEDFLDNNGKGFQKDDALSIRNQIRVRDNARNVRAEEIPNTER